MLKLFYKSLVIKLKFFKEYLNKNLKKGFIKKSQSLVALPILFIFKFNDKRENTLCIYVNYRKLNNITIKNRYLLLNI